MICLTASHTKLLNYSAKFSKLDPRRLLEAIQKFGDDIPPQKTPSEQQNLEVAQYNFLLQILVKKALFTSS